MANVLMYFQLERMIDDFQNQKSGPNFGPLRAVLTIFCVKKHSFFGLLAQNLAFSCQVLLSKNPFSGIFNAFL